MKQVLEERIHYSYSALSEYMLCPLKFFFHRIARVKPESTSVNLILGKTLHRIYALVMAHLYGKNQKPLESSEMEKVFLAEFEGHVAKAEKVHYGRSNHEKIVENGKAYTRTIVDYFSQKVPGGEELWLEREFMVPISTETSVFEMPMMGIFDAVLIKHSEKLATIIDFKTSATKYPKWKIERNLQSLVYTYGMKQLLDREYRIAFQWQVLLKQKTPTIVEYDYICNEEEIQYLLMLIERIGAGIEKKIFYPNPSFLCSGCEYFQACRKWPGNGTCKI